MQNIQKEARSGYVGSPSISPSLNLSFFAENYSAAVVGTVPHLLGPGLGSSAWLLTPLSWFLWGKFKFA